MMRILLFAAVLFFAGCSSPEMDAERGAEICKQSGIPEGTVQFANCVGTQVTKMQETRIETRQAFAGGMQAYGAGIQRYPSYAPSYAPSPITPPRLPINCTTMQTQPGMAMTNCY